ncbi:hypothetical protein BDW42DRAFT_190586 [Aspergillus taichungensis]|uniref:Uncharacterized protein n=1 Tax=Aspergillus taichungensis TaxID=482145 RepID=A0A2J5I7P5_9EURO|nr:hypothetical protein BDW42DRAFT_190586 [Aspergillus taichungensis]
MTDRPLPAAQSPALAAAAAAAAAEAAPFALTNPQAAVRAASTTMAGPSQALDAHAQQQQQQQQPADPAVQQAGNHVPATAVEASGPGGPTATAPFLRDFSLVAEAAKRAQVSVMTRDLESVTL